MIDPRHALSRVSAVEIPTPTPQDAVHLGDGLAHRPASRPPARDLPHSIPHPLPALGRWYNTGILFPVLGIQHLLHAKPQELDTFRSGVRHPRFLLVQSQRKSFAQERRRLHHPVAHVGNAQRPHLPAGLRNVHAADRPGLVAPLAQRARETLKKSVNAEGLDHLDRYSVRPRRSLVAPHLFPRHSQKPRACDPLPFHGFRPLRCGFPTCFSLAFAPSFAEAGREARLKPALFLRGYSPSPTG